MLIWILRSAAPSSLNAEGYVIPGGGDVGEGEAQSSQGLFRDRGG